MTWVVVSMTVEDEDEFDENLGSGDNVDGEDGKGKKGFYDSKEKVARDEIKVLYEELMEKLEEVKKDLGDIVGRETKMIARQYRVELSLDEINELERMEDLNKYFTTASIYLTDFFSFTKGVSPRFDLVINLIFAFQGALIEEQGRPFAKIRREKGQFYLSKNLIDNYLKGIDIHLSRIVATLGSAGTYIAVVPVSTRDSGYEGERSEDEFEEGLEDEGSREGVNSKSWWKKDEDDSVIEGGAKITPKRDFGDKIE